MRRLPDPLCRLTQQFERLGVGPDVEGRADGPRGAARGQRFEMGDEIVDRAMNETGPSAVVLELLGGVGARATDEHLTTPCGLERALTRESPNTGSVGRERDRIGLPR